MIHTELFLFWGSFIGSVLNVITTWAISQHYRWGWIAALAVQLPWGLFGFLSGQYPLTVLAMIYSVLYVRGYRRASKLLSLLGNSAEFIQCSIIESG